MLPTAIHSAGQAFFYDLPRRAAAEVGRSGDRQPGIIHADGQRPGITMLDDQGVAVPSGIFLDVFIDPRPCPGRERAKEGKRSLISDD